MYEHTIREQVEFLVKAKIISKRKSDKAVKELQDKYWHNKIAIVWDVEDVIEHAKNTNVTLTEDEALKILKDAEHNHDCSYGITWDTFQYYIDEIVHDDVLKVKNAKEEELPLLIGSPRTEKAQKMLERRLKGMENWEDDKASYHIYPAKE
jgi:hypothetical protein